MANLLRPGRSIAKSCSVKLLNDPRHKVFAALTDPKALAERHAGLSIENHEADIREGGVWRFDMRAFEGQEQRFPNLMRFLEIVPNERIVMDDGMLILRP